MYLSTWHVEKLYEASVDITRQGDFDMPLLTRGLLRKSSHFSWKLKDARRNREKLKESMQLPIEPRALDLSHQFNTELWTTAAQW